MLLRNLANHGPGRDQLVGVTWSTFLAETSKNRVDALLLFGWQCRRDRVQGVSDVRPGPSHAGTRRLIAAETAAIHCTFPELRKSARVRTGADPASGRAQQREARHAQAQDERGGERGEFSADENVLG